MSSLRGIFHGLGQLWLSAKTLINCGETKKTLLLPPLLFFFASLMCQSWHRVVACHVQALLIGVSIVASSLDMAIFNLIKISFQLIF